MADENLQVEIRVPPDLEGGSYSNFVGVWHTPHEFTIDFCSTQPNNPGEELKLSAVAVSRVKLPPSLVFDVLRALSDNLDKYEKTFGPIRRPDIETKEDDPDVGS